MWDTPFDESMLNHSSCVVVRCPDESLAFELMGILEEHRVKWAGGERPTAYTKYYEYGERTVYWIEDGVLAYSSMQFAEINNERPEDSILCTFYGSQRELNEEFDPVTDEVLFDFLGIRQDRDK